jgi:hypothetical protein
MIRVVAVLFTPSCRAVCRLLGFLRGGETVVPFGGPMGIAAILGEE